MVKSVPKKWEYLTTNQIRKTEQYQMLSAGTGKSNASRKELLELIDREIGECVPVFVDGYKFKKSRNHVYPKKKKKSKCDGWDADKKKQKKKREDKCML